MQKKKVLIGIMALILFALPFAHVNIGIDFADVGYNLANYENFPHIDKTWMISTIGALLIGKGLTFLPFGHTMLGMNIYCTIIFAAVIIFFFVYFAKKYSIVPAFLGALIAELISWCPYVILYHYFSYFLFSMAAVLLARALNRQNYKLTGLSAGLLAFNVFVKFPNILDISLGAIILLYAFFKKENVRKHLITFIVTYICTIAGGVLLIDLLLGKNSYFEMIRGLSGISENASSYSVFNMISTILEGYRWDFIYFVILFAASVCVLLITRKINSKKLIICMSLGMCLVTLAVARVMRYYGRITFSYSEIFSYYPLAVVAILLCMALFFFILFNRNEDIENRMLAAALIIVIIVTPIGSNNGLYTLINNTYAVFPFALCVLSAQIRKDSFMIPIASVAILWSVMLAFQGFIFHLDYVFNEEGALGAKYQIVQSNERLRFMKTSENKRKAIEEASDYFEKNEMIGNDAIIFGRIPMASYAFELNNAISHIWPLLPSYPGDSFEHELKELSGTPAVVYCSDLGDLINDGYPNGTKEEMLSEYLNNNGYMEVFRNSVFVICMPNNR